MAGTLVGKSKSEVMYTRMSFPDFCSLNSSSFDMKMAPVTELPSWHMQEKLQENPYLSGQRRPENGVLRA